MLPNLKSNTFMDSLTLFRKTNDTEDLLDLPLSVDRKTDGRQRGQMFAKLSRRRS